MFQKIVVHKPPVERRI
ncbi:hypothetical protein CC817_23605 [Salmonella enterica subsp. enterica serovar Kentucky]|nr:hypothetical protein [Salmonella enterica subsp. enterica serovar Kentucky]